MTSESEKRKPTLYLVDDESDQIALQTAQLERSGSFTTVGFTDPLAALEKVLVEPPDGVVCDLVMPAMSGLELTRRLRETHPFLPVIIATGKGSAEDAEACFAAGATDFVTKPLDPGTLTARIRKALGEVASRELLEVSTRARFDPHGIIGAHPRIRELRGFIEDVGGTVRVSALLLGESGTGKNLVARAIHAASEAAAHRFVEVNCAALPANLLEAELFGYEKGAFTDARQTKKGLVEEADHGTLFLDEVGSMPPELQAKLLTFIESRSFRRVGGTRDLSVELRIVAATNTDLERQVREGGFREDLYYRLNVASHTLPPLREIASDIPELARHFVLRAAEYFRKPVPDVDPEGVRRLELHRWPGNARELRNVVERAMIFSGRGPLRFGAEALVPVVMPDRRGEAGPARDGAAVGPGRTPGEGFEGDGAGVAGFEGDGAGVAGFEGDGAGVAGFVMTGSDGRTDELPTGEQLHLPRGLTLEEVERRYIEATLEDTGGRINEAADRLGLTRKVFWNRRKRLGML